jgi:hypothetical protein
MDETQNTILKRDYFTTRLTKGHGPEHIVIFGVLIEQPKSVEREIISIMSAETSTEVGEENE